MRKSLLAAAVSGCFVAPLAIANPTGPAVVSGSATFATAGKTLTVTNTPSAIINWQGFSIGTGEATRFQQQSVQSAVMNRVVGQDPSAILGTLSSNGRVFLLNPNGIVFGAGSVVNVAGLVATTLNLSDHDFLAGKLNFQAGAAANSVVNQGAISAANGGFVYLIAPDVQNHGVIQTPQGQTILAAGRSVQLVEADVPDLRVELQAGGEALNVGQILAEGGAAGIYAGLINQQGLVRANSVSRDATGRIVFRSDVLINTGSVQADGAQGGSVAVQARNVLSAGRISADGSQGAGGEVDIQASGRILQTSAAHLSADGATGGGKVTLQATDRVFGSGTLTASGTGAGSTGGEIKVLANEIVLLGASLDASGDAGGGSVLIGGDFQGNNPAVQNATTNWINFSTTINADARTAGNGGKIIVWSDQETQFYGSISARGGAQSGDGGFIEVSGKEKLVFGGMADAGAPNGRPGTLLLDPKFIVIDSAGGGGLSSFLLVDPNPGASNGFADQIVVLPNDNVVATDPRDDFAASDAGAVYLFNGTTGALISTLSGSSASDRVGEDGVTALSNGNFVVSSPSWSIPAGATSVGAVTWGSGTTGVSGAVSAANSLVGTTAQDGVGRNDNDTFRGVTALSNGNYVVTSFSWSIPAGAANVGAVTWGNGAGGTVGPVTAANSLIGTTANDAVGSDGITALTNGNYVVRSPLWDGAAVNVGAVTWGDGSTAGPRLVGPVSAANSLVGTTLDDQVGRNPTASLPGVFALTNGNYVVVSEFWNNSAAAGGSDVDVGAATWGNGAGGTVGAVSDTNSLIGTTSGDRVGRTTHAFQGATSNNGVTPLSNGNYVVTSSNWSIPAGTQSVGAVTWGDGSTAGPRLVGPITAANSLVGTTIGDAVGLYGVTALLGNGNYVVSSPFWDGAAANVGAVTWGNGAGGTVGAVSAANSLVGTTASDAVGSGGNGGVPGVTALSNGNYVVLSAFWDIPAGAAGVGAVTWGDGSTAGPRLVGPVSAANSLVGTTLNDNVGSDGITALTNGNYVVLSRFWDIPAGALNVGAVTWGNGAGGTVGPVSAANSLVGTTSSAGVGGGAGGRGVTALSNGNYVVTSDDWDSALADTDEGAATWGNGSTAGPRLVGTVTAANSLIGTTAGDNVGRDGATALPNGNYVVISSDWSIPAGAQFVGAVTWGNGAGGTVGPVTTINSLVGTITDDAIGTGGVTPLSNGNFVVRSPNANNGAIVDAGLVHVVMPSGGGGFTNPLGFADNAAGTSTITPAQITAITNTGTAVMLQASTDVTLATASAITTSAGGAGGSITMQAGRSVLLNSNITTDNGNLTITANDAGAQAANRDAGAGGITMAAGTTLNAGTGMVTLTVGSGVPGAASGNLVVENIAAVDVNLQQIGSTNGSSILRASGASLITATHLLMEVDLTGSGTGGSVGTAAAPMRVAVTNLESHTHEASPGIFIDSPAQGLTIGGVPFFAGSVKGVQNVTSGDLSVTANGNLTTQAGTAGCGATGGTGGPICTGSSITLVAGNGDLSIGNVVTHTGAGAGSLAARATNSILVGSGANITSGGGAFGITLNSDSDGSGAGAVVLGNFAPLVTINSNGGNILIGGGTGAAGFAVGEAVNDIGIYLNGAALSSGAGSITLRGQGLLDRGVSMQTGSGSSIQSTTGAIAIFGNAGAGTEPGIRISQLQTVTSTSGNIALTGNAGGTGTGIEMWGQVSSGGNIALTGTGTAGGSASLGMEISNGGVVSASGGGTVTLTGQGGAGTDSNIGVLIRGATNAVTSVNGNITINATGGASSSSGNVGLQVDLGGGIESTGAGSIALTGQGGTGTTGNYGVKLLGGPVVAAGGNIFIQGTGGGSTNDNVGVWVQPTLLSTTAAGTITIIGLGSGASVTPPPNFGVSIRSPVSSVDGLISITGTASGGGGAYGIDVSSGIQATGTGGITMVGQGGAGDVNNNGVNLFGAAAVVSTVNGAISVTGTGAGNLSGNRGIQLDFNASIQSTGSGNVTLVGQASTAGTTNNYGILLNNASVAAAGGALTLTGTGGGSGANNDGMLLGFGSITSTGSQPIVITGNGAGTAPGIQVIAPMTIGGASHSGDLVLRAGTASGTDSIVLASTVNGAGNLFIEPLNSTATIGLAGGAGRLNLSSADLSTLADGFSQITIGHPSGTGLINVGSHTFNDPIIIRNTGAGSAGIVSSGTLAAGANDLNLFSAGLVNVTQGTVSGANIGITAGSLVVQPGVSAISSSLVDATGNLTVNANAVLLRGSDTAASLTAKLQAAGAITINAGSLSIEGGNANNASAAIDPTAITITTTGNVTLQGGIGNDAYALIHVPAGNLAINAPTGVVSLVPGTGTNANAAVVASLGTAQMLTTGCTGCTPLLVNPISGPSLLASGIFGNPVTVNIVVPTVVPAAAVGGDLFSLSGFLNTSNAALIEMGDEDGAQELLVVLSGGSGGNTDEQTIFSCR